MDAPKWLQQGARRIAEKIAEPVLEPGQEEVGLGDVVHGVTKRVGLKHCHGCAKRKKAMNRRVAFGRPR